MKNAKLATHKICARCGQTIRSDEDYYMIQAYLAGDYKGKVYIHKACFDDITLMKKATMKAVAVLDRLQGITN